MEQAEEIRDLVEIQRKGRTARIAPVSYEDPMHPGQAKAMPIRKTRQSGKIIFDNGYTREEVTEAELSSGQVKIVRHPFVPVLPKQKGHSCTVCTGCGRCSW